MPDTLLNMVVAADGTISLQGELSFMTVEGALTLSHEIFSEQSGDLIIDLGGVTRGDSAGLALLIHWVRELWGSGRYLSFTHTPTHLLRLVQASDLEDILPFAPAAEINLEN